MSKRLLLVDGNSILNRGFFGLPLLTDGNGIYTNAVLGFFNILLKVMTDERPDYLAVAFDVHHPTFRHEMYAAYKGTRKPMPEELKMQLPIIREVLSSMDVVIVEKPGYEADDILGTLAKKYEKEGLEVTLLSGDRDLLQIASEHIKISIPKTSMGKTETHHYYEKDVIAEYQVTPLEFIDVKALQGDTSDNIPGVPKVGPKTATELICAYHSLDGVYEHINEITKKALFTNLSENKEQAYLSKALATINTSSPVDIDLEKAVNKRLLNDASMEVLLKYSLKSIINKLETMGDEDASEVKERNKEVPEFSFVEDFNETAKILEKMQKAKAFGFYEDGDKGFAVSFSEKETYYVSLYGFVTKDYVKETLSKLVDSNVRIYSAYIKDSYDMLGNYGKNLEDAQILAYLYDPNKGEYPFTYLCESFASKYYGDQKEIDADSATRAVIIALNSKKICETLLGQLHGEALKKLYYDVEMPLSFVLYSMEKEGVLVDRKALEEFSVLLAKDMDTLEKGIYEKAGEEFNINSPKQLGEILFEKLGLQGGKKTKSGYSTAADVLEKLAPENKIVAEVLEYRTLAKLKSTYADGLTDYIEEDGRIHTHFNQTITATGRISSTEPNLQNIPIRTELGRELRKVFYPKEGYVFVDADYSQIELRLMAHMSGDPNLIEAYKEGRDIHRSTASLVFKTPFEEVTADQRRNAKAVNFGIIYGISAFGLSQDINTSVQEAKKYIEGYFESYPCVKEYLDKTVAEAKEKGFTTTLFGRIRPIPELKASNFMQRSFGERVAMNAPLQGTAADIMKIAMIGIFNRLKKETPDSKMLIQVHDEVLIETKNEDVDKVITIVKEEMSRAASLSVPLEADAKTGLTWYDAH